MTDRRSVLSGRRGSQKEETEVGMEIMAQDEMMDSLTKDDEFEYGKVLEEVQTSIFY